MSKLDHSLAPEISRGLAEKVKQFNWLSVVVSVTFFSFASAVVFPVFAEEVVAPSLGPSPVASVSPSPENTPLPTVTPLPSPEPSTSPTSDESQALFEPQVSPIPSASDSATVDSELFTTNSSAVITQSNSTSQTGNNLQTSTDSAQLQTGSATATSVVNNQLNVTTLGTSTVFQQHTLDSPPTGSVNLSSVQLQTSQPAISAASTINLTNTAVVSNQIAGSAETGNNQLSAQTALLTTGNAEASALLFNSLNTSLIGNCWYYNVITIISPVEGDIWLPNEEEFLNCPITDQLAPVQLLPIESGEQLNLASIANEAEVNSTVFATATTGDNQIKGENITQTGETTVETQIVDHLNETFVGDDWWLIRVTNPEYWQGTVNGQATPLTQIGASWYFGPATSPVPTTLSNLAVTLTNSANLDNQVELTANTGGNQISASVSETNTGDASVVARILNYVNTTVIGNRWYFADLNLFSPFTGNIRTTKPDLLVEAIPQNTIVTAGQPANISFRITNLGTSLARQATLHITLPQGIKLILTEPGVVSRGQTVVFTIDELPAGASTDVHLVLGTDETAHTVTILAFVSNLYTDSNESNNQALSTLEILVPIPTAQSTPTPSQLLTRVLPQRQPQSLRQVRQPNRRIVTANVPRVLGAIDNPVTNDSVVAASPVESHSLSFCQRNQSLCNFSQYGFAGFMGSLYLYQRRHRLKLV